MSQEVSVEQEVIEPDSKPIFPFSWPVVQLISDNRGAVTYTNGSLLIADLKRELVPISFTTDLICNAGASAFLLETFTEQSVTQISGTSVNLVSLLPPRFFKVIRYPLL